MNCAPTNELSFIDKFRNAAFQTNAEQRGLRDRLEGGRPSELAPRIKGIAGNRFRQGGKFVKEVKFLASM